FDVLRLLPCEPLRPKAVDLLRRSLALSLRHFYFVLRHPPKLLTASSTTLSASAWLWPAEAALDLPGLPGGEALRLECSDALGRSLSLLRGHLLLPPVYGFRRCCESRFSVAASCRLAFEAELGVRRFNEPRGPLLLDGAAHDDDSAFDTL